MSYIHRVGRTGRAKKEGEAVTLFTDEDKFIVRKLADLLKTSGCEVPQWIFSIKKKRRDYFKKLIKKPIKRENIIKKKRDKEFNKDIKKRDYFYHRNKEMNKGEEEEWVVVGDKEVTVNLEQ